EMLAKAKAADGVRFEQGDIARFDRASGASEESEPDGRRDADRGRIDRKGWDLIFSNAALQWVPDNEAILARLAKLLAPGGQIAVQVPANDDHLSHTTAAEIALEPPFREALGGHVRTSSILAPERYAAVLHRLGFREPEVLL